MPISKVINITLVVDPLPPKSDQTLITKGNRFLSVEVPELNVQMIATIDSLNEAIDQINNTSGIIDGKVNLMVQYTNSASNSANQAENYKNQTLQIKTEVQEIVDTLVIPIQATYNKEYLDKQFSKIKIQDFLNFKI